MFTRLQHAVVLVLGTMALATGPSTGGAVYWATLIPAVYGTLYGLVYGVGRVGSFIKAKLRGAANAT